MVKRLVSMASVAYIIGGAILMVFFFSRGGQWLAAPLGQNWAYIFDQLTLPVIAGLVAWRYLAAKKDRFRLDWLTIVILLLSVLATHYYSFYRTFFNDEWLNILWSLRLLNDHTSVSFVFLKWREVYAWGPFTLVYQLVTITKPWSLPVFSGVAVLLLAGASLAGAWLTGVISRNRLAALVAGLLIGISPNTFGSLPWLSNIQGDSFGIILTLVTVGTWLIARRSKDSTGILVALLMLAATLKGGGAVRSATVGALLGITDIIFFSRQLIKRGWLAWVGIASITGLFYILNYGAHVSSGFQQQIPLAVGLAHLADATTRAFIPPVALAKLLPWLDKVTPNSTWVIWLGGGLFLLGSAVALIGLFQKSLRIFTWGWLWFYATIFYVPWLAVGFSPNFSGINDQVNLLYGGYKYAYLPLIGLYLAVAIIVGRALANKTWRIPVAVLMMAIVLIQSYEFMQLDRLWSLEKNRSSRAWYQALITIVPPEQTSAATPRALLIVDGKNNPLASAMAEYREFNFITSSLYPEDSLFVFNDFSSFSKKAIAELKIPAERVFALGWDSGSQKMIDLTGTFRQWLVSHESVNWRETNFDEWTSSTPKENGFFAPQFGRPLGKNHLVREPFIISPPLRVPIPSGMVVTLDLSVEAKNDLPADGTVLERVALNSQFPNTLLLPRQAFDPTIKKWYDDNFGEILKGGLLTLAPELLTKQDYYVSKAQFRDIPPVFRVGAICQSDHGKLQAKQLFNNQELLVNQLARQQVELTPQVVNGNVILSAALPCQGPELHRLVILGPPNARFTINELTISFP